MQDHDIRNLRYVYECLGFKKKKKLVLFQFLCRSLSNHSAKKKGITITKSKTIIQLD